MDIHWEKAKYVNCIIHDFSDVGLWADALGAEMYGCIIFHNGWSGVDRGYGHGLYVQNDKPAKVIKDCIIFDNFGWGIHAYADKGMINNIILDGCVCFGAGSLYPQKVHNILIGGWASVALNPTVQNCMTYGSNGINIGYNAGAENIVLTDNYAPDGIVVNGKVTADKGNYRGPAIGNRVFLRPNEYKQGRAHLIIYNEAKAESVLVDVSSLYKDGDVVQIRNVQDYFKDIQLLSVEKGMLKVSMIDRTVSAPVAWKAPESTFPLFGCFVTERI